MAEPEPRFPVPPEYRPAIAAGLVLGVVAALLVWWLERFEVRRVIVEAEDVLKRHAAFDEYLRERGAALRERIDGLGDGGVE